MEGEGHLECWKCKVKMFLLLKVLVLDRHGHPIQEFWCRRCVKDAFGGE